MKYKYNKSTNKLIEVAELPLRVDETGNVQIIELEWIWPKLPDGTVLDESEIDKVKIAINPFDNKQWIDCFNDNDAKYYQELGLSLRIGARPKTEQTTCKNWSECTAKEPRHCALEGCQKEIQEKADIANEDFRCGEGDNRCNCHHPSQCGYIPIMKMENEIFGDINLVHGGENGKDDQHISDETLSAKLRNDLVLLAGINGDEQVMEAAYKAAKQALLLKEIDTQITAYKKITGFHSPEELNAYNKGRQDEQKAIEAWMQKWDGINSDFVELLASKLTGQENVKDDQHISDKARLHAKEVERYFSFPSSIEAYRLRAKNSYQRGYNDALKEMEHEETMNALKNIIDDAIIKCDPYDISVLQSIVDLFTKHKSPQPYKECEGEKKLLSTDEVCDMINKAPNFFDLISKKGEGEKPSRDWLKDLGFVELPHFTIMNSLEFDLGRNRKLSIGCLGEPNEMMTICETDSDNSKKVTDLVVLHNWDYDRYLTKEKVTHLLKALTQPK